MCQWPSPLQQHPGLPRPTPGIPLHLQTGLHTQQVRSGAGMYASSTKKNREWLKKFCISFHSNLTELSKSTLLVFLLCSVSGQCEPVCAQGCVNGTCMSPGVCQCHFGFVGDNCSSQCSCNKHSNCAGVNKPDVCLECHNNTIVSGQSKSHANTVNTVFL